VGLLVTVNRMMAVKVTVPVEVADIRIPEGDPVAIARGNYLIDNVLNCKICHAPDFGGRAEINDSMIGKLWGKNLTAGIGSATKNYTPRDWVRSIRHGVGTDGRRLMLMPSEDFQTFSDEDLGAVVAAVKSKPPVDRPDEGIHLGPLGMVLLAIGEVGFAYDKVEHARARPAVAVGNTVEWGRVMAGTCTGCHGESFSGGPIPGGDPSWPPARNLTPDETGIKAWTLADFINTLRTGKRPDGTDIKPPMPWQAYKGLTDTDLEALYLYLRTVPARPAGGR
jgi:mono/diheme cytochrome c family protein